MVARRENGSKEERKKEREEGRGREKCKKTKIRIRSFFFVYDAMSGDFLFGFGIHSSYHTMLCYHCFLATSTRNEGMIFLGY